ncbi:MAG: arginine--tRNA ligase [Candidatus Pacebacteria bacterium]|nr:arginine--tRNA ligase [Candidatus Paceibacterota bacterium]
MLREILRQEIEKAVLKLFDKKAVFNVSWDGKFSDYSSNAGLFLGGKDEAEKLKDELAKSKEIEELFSEIKVAGNGFINFRLSEKGIEDGLKFALKEKFDFLKSEKIQVEFISANPTGPLTLGNGRGGVFGDVLGNVFKKAGAEVVKEYYINNAGNQIEILGHSVLKDDKAEYKGEYIDELGKKLGGEEPLEVGKKAADIILESIKKTVSEMGIDFDVWFSESKELRETGKVEEIMRWLKEKDLAYEKDDALWFRATKFGDSEDRVLIKTGGEPTYFGVDCAYHKNKFEERKFDRVINIWGADHHGDVKRVKGFIDALGHKDKFEIILMQFVRLFQNGAAARMSKREGVYVLVDDVLKEIGKDAFRYFMLTRSPDTHMDFDLELAKEQSKKNPVYYIQYAGARMSNILKKSEAGLKNEKIEIQNLTEPQERRLLLKLIQFPEMIESVSRDYQVHRLTTYIYELAAAFTDFYENVRVLEAEGDELKNSRLLLVSVSRRLLEQVLGLLGISAPEKM